MEPKFFIVNTAKGWGQCTEGNWEIDGDGIAIKKDPVSTYVSQEPVFSAEPGSPVEVGDLALDECGNMYVALTSYDGSRNAVAGDVYYYNRSYSGPDRVCNCTSAKRPLGHIGFKDPVALKVSADTIYVVDRGEGRLYSISRYRLQIRWTLDDSYLEGASAMAIDGSGRVFVLNAKDGSIAEISPEGDGITVIVSGLYMPLDLAVDEAGCLYVLEKAGEHEYCVKKYTGEDCVYTPEDWITAEMFKDVIPATGTLPGPSCMARGPKEELLVGETGDNPADRTLLRFLGEKGAFARIFAYRGTARRLAMDTCRDLYVVTGDGKKIVCLRYGLKNNLNGENYSARATKHFDSGMLDTNWHRLKLDFDLPGTMVQVRCRYYASNDPGTPAAGGWKEFGLPNPRDALFDDATGRYLWVEISLLGTEFDSPRIRSIKVYFPRTSYLRYLPAIYQEDEASRRFLERFLSLFESFFTDTGESIGSITKYADAMGVPSQYLAWLGSWLAISRDEGWPEDRRRKLIAMAPELFKMRGTREGLLMILKLYAGEPGTTVDWNNALQLEEESLESLVESGDMTPEEAQEELDLYREMVDETVRNTADFPIILEYLQLASIEDPEARESYLQLLGCPNCFVAIMGPWLGEEGLKAARRVVDSEKPAHTEGTVVGLQPWAYLGGHMYLGVNTVLSKPEFILEEAWLGKNTVLEEREPLASLGLKSRTDKDYSLS